MIKQPFSAQSGVSLLEALIAMAVMAFGMLALLGLQAALRGSSDISKQRAEAVRFAQESIEDRRSFSVLASTASRRAYDDILDQPTPEIVSLDGYTASSAVFSRVVRVADVPTASLTPSVTDLYYTPSRKLLRVEVTWPDRNNEEQRVELSTLVSRTAPEIAGALSVNGGNSPVRNLLGRNPVIPPGAINLTGADSGKSIFGVPTTGTPFFWKFDNKTGFIVGRCLDATGASCTTVNQRLLWGYIRYAVSTVGQPTSVQSETPPDLGLPGVTVGMVMHQPINQPAVPFPVAEPVVCYVNPLAVAYGAYYCALEFDVLNSHVDPPSIAQSWSGRSTVTINGCWDSSTHNDGPAEQDLSSPYRCTAADAALFASSPSDNSASKFRICRYTTRRDNSVVGSGTPPFTNLEHPLNYLAESGSLSNQSFLVIRAGNGATAFTCPEDDGGTPIIGTTWDHQPPRPPFF